MSDPVNVALSQMELLTGDLVESLLENLKKESTDKLKHVGFTTATLMRVADSYPPAVKNMVRMVIRRREQYPGYRESPGFYRLDQFESLARWYERKCSHRYQMYALAGNVETIKNLDFDLYILTGIIPAIPRLANRDLYQTAYKIICTEGVLFACPAPTPNDILIKKLLASTLLDEIDEGVSRSEPDFDREPIKWFSVQNMLLTLSNFRRIDSGGKGMLAYEDLFNLEHLNPVFLKGFWSSPRCYKFIREVDRSSPDSDKETESVEVVETDLSGFVCLHRLLFHISTLYDVEPQLNCAMEYLPVLSYVFRCLSESWESCWSLKHFEHIVENLHKKLLELDSSCDILLTDMVSVFLNYLNPADPKKITFADVVSLDKHLSSGANSLSTLFLGMLVDAKKFQLYDNRAGV